MGAGEGGPTARIRSDPARDLTREQAAAAARVEASFGREDVDALLASYPHAASREALASIHGSARLVEGVPEVCLGVSAWVQAAG